MIHHCWMGKTEVVLRCRILGHRFRFTHEAETMTWRCQRACGAGGAKRYPTAGEAERYAKAFDKEDRETLGQRAPLVALLPLRIWRTLRRKPAHPEDAQTQ